MSAGLEVRRDGGGRLVLRSNRANPVLRHSGVATTVANTITPSGGSRFEVQYSGTAPMCCVRPSQGTFLHVASQSGGTWTWVFVTDAPVGSGVPFYVFDLPAGLTAGPGLTLFADAAGAPVNFSMAPGSKPLRAVDVITAGEGGAYPAGRLYAACQGLHFGRLSYEPGAQPPGGGAPDEAYFALTQSSGTFAFETANAVTFSEHRMDAGAGALQGSTTPDLSRERYWTNKQLLVVDVTGY